MWIIIHSSSYSRSLMCPLFMYLFCYWTTHGQFRPRMNNLRSANVGGFGITGCFKCLTKPIGCPSFTMAFNCYIIQFSWA